MRQVTAGLPPRCDLMMSVGATQHQSLCRLYRISHCTIWLTILQEETAKKWVMVFALIENSVSAVLSKKLNTAFCVSGESY